MAKKGKKSFVNPLDALGVAAEEVNPPPAANASSRRRSQPAADEASPMTPSARRRARFTAPTDQLSRQDVRRASTNKSMAGQYQRKTITLPPEQVDFIKELANREQIGVLEFYRWLIDTALLLYEEGERPQVEYREVRGETNKGHWSSQSEQS